MTPISNTDSILAMGDSLTYGFLVSAEENYPSQLSKMSGYHVINAGINGDTSGEALERFPRFPENSSIRIMILCIGANDILQRQSMISLRQNIKKMIQMAKEKEIKILLVAVPNFTLFGLSDLDLYEEIAQEESVVLASGILSNILEQPSLKIDQVHPNALGYEKMAEMIYKSLKEEELID